MQPFFFIVFFVSVIVIIILTLLVIVIIIAGVIQVLETVDEGTSLGSINLSSSYGFIYALKSLLVKAASQLSTSPFSLFGELFN
jgi:hypothetical protein